MLFAGSFRVSVYSKHAGSCIRYVLYSYLFSYFKRETSRKKNKYVIYMARSVRMGKNCALCFEYGPRPRAVLKTSGTVFFPYGPPAR